MAVHRASPEASAVRRQADAALRATQEELHRAQALALIGNFVWDAGSDAYVAASPEGYRIFDFGRSKKGTGSHDFKKNWGFEPTPLFYEYKLVRATEVPDTNPLNPKYQLMIRTWQKMPIALANFIGPHIVKNLG